MTSSFHQDSLKAAYYPDGLINYWTIAGQLFNELVPDKISDCFANKILIGLRLASSFSDCQIQTIFYIWNVSSWPRTHTHHPD